jgi:hypothetical protein
MYRGNKNKKDYMNRVMSEEYYGEPNDALAVQSAELTSHLSEDDSEGKYPLSSVVVYTGGGREGTTLLLYKGSRYVDGDRSADVVFKSHTPFSTIVRTLDSVGGSREDEDIKSVLRNLDRSELAELIREKAIDTTNIPNEILDLTGRHVPEFIPDEF